MNRPPVSLLAAVRTGHRGPTVCRLTPGCPGGRDLRVARTSPQGRFGSEDGGRTGRGIGG